jgi:16S rRNA (guanine966-N2)-methyltransferase
VFDGLIIMQQKDVFHYDLILLDPPFATDHLLRILPLAASLLAPDGLIYIEWHVSCEQAPAVVECLAFLNLEVIRAQRAGQVYYHLVRFSKLLS